MFIRELSELLGWIVAIGYALAMMNFLLKFIHRKYISKLKNGNKTLINIYKLIMKYVVKYHKLIGIMATLFVIVHLTIMSLYVGVSLTGIIAMAIMLLISILGIYGAYINKNFKGSWLKIHRILAFSLLIAIGIHIL